MEKLRKYYVVDSILHVKRLILGESFVTDLECRKISEALEKKLKKNGYSIEIATQLESSCPFEVISHGIIVEKHSPEYPLYPLKSYIYDEKVRELIYDENFIISCLYNMQLKKIKYLGNKL